MLTNKYIFRLYLDSTELLSKTDQKQALFLRVQWDELLWRRSKERLFNH